MNQSLLMLFIGLVLGILLAVLAPKQKTFAAHLTHGHYILRHKWFVFVECCKLGVPLLGIIHDMSRFDPREWIPYAMSSPYNKGNKPLAVANAFEKAWNGHQHANKHHWEYWVHFDYHDHSMRCLPIPNRYLREMLADWRGAGKAKNSSDTPTWYEANRNAMQLHSESRAWLEEMLRYQKQGYSPRAALRMMRGWSYEKTIGQQAYRIYKKENI